ncbi:hypothetical protein RRV45_07670 [Bacillus sp. DTU_2020_1000418_1_SI_GHA_SEK_038]|uniref:hypothetical protein n=1 Tax=Bacillus sp. DTU_2020_1000418_1_SI_GHA_SEK_038 TaxID=3077585 RepID=UPI0028E51EB1|nr:hypothetical protein [Bacillus sp. DTU_2020_1000418_1_SI_GHA_SEK_038]WNS76856.1 hypothetical protein RRV45_07670 [Bacillus sp. DTU_2020_1000418_1_SI_GHA_SEK_038]
MNTENDNKHGFTKSNRLNQLMFGSVEKPSANNVEFEETHEEMEYESSNRIHNRFDSLMLRERHHPSPKENTNNSSLSNHLNHVVNNINFVELMDNIDTIVSTAKQLKPLYRKVTPLIDQILKKKDE